MSLSSAQYCRDITKMRVTDSSGAAMSEPHGKFFVFVCFWHRAEKFLQV